GPNHASTRLSTRHARVHALQPEQGPVFLWEPRWPQVATAYDVLRDTCRKLAPVTTDDLVAKRNHARMGPLQPGPHDDLFVVPRWRMKPAVCFGDREQYAVIALHRSILGAEGTAQLRAADFHPDQVVRVIHHAHLIRFRVPDPQSRFVGTAYSTGPMRQG